MQSDPPPATCGFTVNEVARHLRQHHPRCPPAAFAAVVARVVGRRHWAEPRLGRAVGVAATCYVRHELTDYERLLKRGLTREEARLAVAREVQAIIAAWGPGPPQPSG